jgi:hypothetical protein
MATAVMVGGSSAACQPISDALAKNRILLVTITFAALEFCMMSGMVMIAPH